MPTDATARAPAGAGFNSGMLGLYALVVFGWGTSWILMRPQLGIVAPEVSLLYRFALATAIMFLWMAAARHRLRFPPADHGRFALMGLLLFSVNFDCMYHAGLHLSTGLCAVVFATATFWNIVFSRLLFGVKIEPRVALAAVIGLSGMLLVFWPEIERTSFGHDTVVSLAYATGATILFSLGNMVSRGNGARGIPVLPASAWGMLYGVGWVALLIVIQGLPLGYDPRPAYFGAVLAHAVFSSVLAFAGYLTLLARIGAERAGYATVLFPIVALGFSTWLEGFQWTLFAVVGLALVLTGNVVILTGKKRAA